MGLSDQDIAAAIVDLARHRGAEKTVCPSDVARALAEEWRPLMPEIRRIAKTLPQIRATQRGVEVDPVTAKGPIRLGLR